MKLYIYATIAMIDPVRVFRTGNFHDPTNGHLELGEVDDR